MRDNEKERSWREERGQDNMEDREVRLMREREQKRERSRWREEGWDEFEREGR